MKRENIMARNPAPKLDEKALTKGELRKLNALRKSVGDDIGDKAFTEWLRKIPADDVATEDKNAAVIADTLIPLIEQNKLRIPRGGYHGVFHRLTEQKEMTIRRRVTEVFGPPYNCLGTNVIFPLRLERSGHGRDLGWMDPDYSGR